MENKLYRSNSERMIAGVCGGVAEYTGIDPTFIRLGFVLLSFAMGGGVLLYIIAALIIPLRPAGMEYTYDRQVYDKDGNPIGSSVRRYRFVGVLLTVIGAFLILDNISWFAAVLIAAGIYFLVFKRGGSSEA